MILFLVFYKKKYSITVGVALRTYSILNSLSNMNKVWEIRVFFSKYEEHPENDYQAMASIRTFENKYLEIEIIFL